MNHLLDERAKGDLRVPAELVACFARITAEVIDFGWTKEARIDLDIRSPVEIEGAESDIEAVTHRVRLSCGDHEVVGLLLLEHQPHCFNIGAGKPPVTTCVEVAQEQFCVEPVFDTSSSTRDFACHKRNAAARTFVIEQNTARDEQPI